MSRIFLLRVFKTFYFDLPLHDARCRKLRTLKMENVYSLQLSVIYLKLLPRVEKYSLWNRNMHYITYLNKPEMKIMCIMLLPNNKGARKPVSKGSWPLWHCGFLCTLLHFNPHIENNNKTGKKKKKGERRVWKHHIFLT